MVVESNIRMKKRLTFKFRKKCSESMCISGVKKDCQVIVKSWIFGMSLFFLIVNGKAAEFCAKL